MCIRDSYQRLYGKVPSVGVIPQAFPFLRPVGSASRKGRLPLPFRKGKAVPNQVLSLGSGELQPVHQRPEGGEPRQLQPTRPLLRIGTLQGRPPLHAVRPGEISLPSDFAALLSQFLGPTFPIGNADLCHIFGAFHLQRHWVILPGEVPKAHPHQPHSRPPPLQGSRVAPAVPLYLPGDLLGPVPAGFTSLFPHGVSSISSRFAARKTAFPAVSSNRFHRHPV